MKSSSHSKLAIRRNRLVCIGLITIGILLVPLVTMQFSEEVDWQPLDFIVIGVLLFGTGLAYEWLSNKLFSKHQQLVVEIVLLLLVLYVWAELAVGIFTNLGS